MSRIGSIKVSPAGMASSIWISYTYPGCRLVGNVVPEDAYELPTAYEAVNET
jgi:hypothetical protein